MAQHNEEVTKKRTKIDLSITPLRLAVVIIGLTLVGLNEFLSWNISLIDYLFPVAVLLSVFLTQPKE